MNTERIPLFPLNIVLLPGQSIPLHIFERRYRVMTRHCVATKSPFGLIFVHEGNLGAVGCSAMITKTLKEYEDGRSDILITGQHAFRLIRTHEEQPYAEADVEFLEEDFTEIDPGVSARVEELFNQCYLILFEGNAEPLETEEGVSLAYQIAAELPLEVSLKQALLELRSEAERQERLLERLSEWYPQLQNRERVRQKASGNGHSKL